MFTTTSTSTSSGGGGGGGSSVGFDVEPSGLQTAKVTLGTPGSPIAYTATLNGNPATQTGWGLDQGALGSLSSFTGNQVSFTPSGTAGGLVNITAALNGATATRQVMIQLSATQNGYNAGSTAEQGQVATSPSQLTAGGGVGGVGGTGLGTAVSDPATTNALANPSGDGSAQGLSFIYPYDQTVFPRGLPAPLLQWTWTPPATGDGGAVAYPGDADAIQISLSTTNGSFSYVGTFGRPAILSMAGVSGHFINHPIPQDIWDAAVNSAAGPSNQLKVSIVVAKDGVGYGPITESWTIAPAILAGTIYYNSYGTQLAQNYSADLEGKLFGGAVLSIHVGDTAPKLVAGGTLKQPETNPKSATDDLCRVCHSVAASGSQLVVQHDANRAWGEGFTLSPTGNTLTDFPDPDGGVLADTTYSGIYPDGSRTLTRAGQFVDLPAGTLSATQPTGLPANPYMPIFSPDGTLVAFNSNAGLQLTVMSFNNTTSAFSNSVTVVSDTAASGLTPAWPAFFPDSKSLVFHHQSYASLDSAGAEPCTRAGALSQLAWTNLAGATSVTALDQLNGKGYLPKLPTASTLACEADGIEVAAGATGMKPDLDHSDDVDHNYEPTVNPIASGGYAWVVFTSRRMYGNVATIPPFCSDPRGVDLEPDATNALATNITPKKLWVAAIDLNQAPGKDSSHPAFYLPSQELLAGNSRGFWVLDPCEANGSSCTSGDQCCGGYCQPDGDGGALICSNTQPSGSCSATGDKCTTQANCCDPTDQCIGGFCSQPTPARVPAR